ncbi:hypothetical protein MUO14_09550 [Halobacillus shinanisalinarum]|uniref:Uncharacterized protein n=1 Tax=Halobacillus shinanisalinarum TaxID=2932258 RepID=A0ABY4H3V8_9BACI|nr:hypothetical protein [Halobacillus shinanisalinarum]UOQ95141.1 hypothetical protein MUO14_09550 [Halobacillus shinanisalinarum]
MDRYEELSGLINKMTEQEAKEKLLEVFSYVKDKGVRGSTEIDQFRKIEKLYKTKVVRVL